MNKVLNLEKALFRMSFDKKWCHIDVSKTCRGTIRWSFRPVTREV